MAENKQGKKKDKKSLTLFIMMIPVLLIAMSAAIDSTVVRLGFQAVLILLELVLVKNLLDDYYGEE